MAAEVGNMKRPTVSITGITRPRAYGKICGSSYSPPGGVLFVLQTRQTIRVSMNFATVMCIIRHIGIVGRVNVLHMPSDPELKINKIEVNAPLSPAHRALASMQTGYPLFSLLPNWDGVMESLRPEANFVNPDHRRTGIGRCRKIPRWDLGKSAV